VSHRALTWAVGSIFCFVVLVPSLRPQEPGASSDANQQAVLRLAKEVRKQIVTQPQYGVFDNIHFAIQGDTVILRGRCERSGFRRIGFGACTGMVLPARGIGERM